MCNNFCNPLRKTSGYSPVASLIRSSGMRGGNNKQEPIKPQQHVLEVAPLNSMPYIGPLDGSSSPTNGDTRPVEKAGPSMIFLPSHTAQKEWDNIIVSASSGVGLTGSAAMGKVGPAVGLMDIGECENSYLFRISLPGVSGDERNLIFEFVNTEEFSCDIEPDGKVLIKGVTTTGERIVCKNSQIFRMQTQNLCPPGHFSITFQLPGPVDHQQFSGYFGTDGMLEGIVKKR